ncbi:MAG TPA: 23S rRNA (adenine(2503)-C(2))-methyltransferase RlmN [Anaerolineaceae bacterium]|nr:23S rRNA (adenine(2503)-C(2))-methyltransferase RlmN [Anaerolineaceae bacterium]
MTKPILYDQSNEILQAVLRELGQPAFRLKQLEEGLYQHRYMDFSKFTTLPKSLLDSLEDRFSLFPLEVKQEIISRDKRTEKFLFKLQDDNYIETVLMHYEGRHTVCISTQVGCPMGCVFCATGQMGYTRNLTAGEILSQIIFCMRKLQEAGTDLTNVVYMGMGEPFLNYDEVMSSITRLTDQKGLNFGARRITISTVGILPRIRQFTEAKSQVNLALSLHAPNDALRSALVPANEFYPLSALIEASKKYTDYTHRRVLIEYALIDGVNDTLAHADELATLLHGMLCLVNLIALNPSQDSSYRGSPREKVEAFRDRLMKRGIQTTIRLKRGIEINAGCGQLATTEKGK